MDIFTNEKSFSQALRLQFLKFVLYHISYCLLFADKGNKVSSILEKVAEEEKLQREQIMNFARLVSFIIIFYETK